MKILRFVASARVASLGGCCFALSCSSQPSPEPAQNKPTVLLVTAARIPYFAHDVALKAILEKSALAKTVPQFPLSWTADSVMLGPTKYPAATTAPILVFPNPLNPKRYLVLNSGFTFREGSTTTNALQTPKLPDWAIIDLRTPPSAHWPGLVVDAGFFDESWQWPKK